MRSPRGLRNAPFWTFRRRQVDAAAALAACLVAGPDARKSLEIYPKRAAKLGLVHHHAQTNTRLQILCVAAHDGRHAPSAACQHCISVLIDSALKTTGNLSVGRVFGRRNPLSRIDLDHDAGCEGRPRHPDTCLSIQLRCFQHLEYLRSTFAKRSSASMVAGMIMACAHLRPSPQS